MLSNQVLRRKIRIKEWLLSPIMIIKYSQSIHYLSKNCLICKYSLKTVTQIILPLSNKRVTSLNPPYREILETKLSPTPKK